MVFYLCKMQNRKNPIGIFDSGYGGLTILRAIKKLLPEYDYIYLGDNARTPYGTRSFDIVYEYTLQSVNYLFEKGCQLVILACNTASAKALRTIQQCDLEKIAPQNRVLGVIRPSVEAIGKLTKTGHVGVLGTPGTITSNSYKMEIEKMYEGKIFVYQEACPMWVPIVENNEIDTVGADFFIKKNLMNLLKKDPKIDTIILGCTHYPLLANTIHKFLPKEITLIDQGPIIADRLDDYLMRHPDIEQNCSKNGTTTFYTTEQVPNFEEKASIFLKEPIKATTICMKQ